MKEMYFVEVGECELRKCFRLSGGGHIYSGSQMCKKVYLEDM